MWLGDDAWLETCLCFSLPAGLCPAEWAALNAAGSKKRSLCVVLH